MRGRVRWLLVLGVAWGVAGLVGSSATAFGEGSPGGEGAGGSSLTEGSLVTPGSPVAGEEAQAGEQAKLTNPEAVAAREASKTKYEGLDSEQAAKVAGEAFPKLVDEPAGGPPGLAAGESITGYPDDNAARIDLGGGKHGVVESMEPIAVETSSGQREPIDLSLGEVGGAFQPLRSDVALRIPKRLADGVQLASTGVTLTPVDEHGAALGGSEGVLDGGATVLYANTQTDTDTVVKPLTSGFEEDTLLRSVESPGQLSYRVGLPEGASLVQPTAGSGPVQVVDEGAVIAVVSPPSAVDAAGTSVQVSMSVSGDELTLSVDDRSGEYQFPIEVDPTVVDNQLTDGGSPLWRASNWREEPAPPSPFEFAEAWYAESLVDHDKGKGYVRGEWGGMAYETQGESHIYELATGTMASNAGANIENKLFIRSPEKGTESEEVLGSSYAKTKKTLCVESGCATGAVSKSNDKNTVEFKQTATNSGNEFESELAAPSVYILQEKGPTVSINTTTETIEGRPNIFHAGKWAGPSGDSEVSATDPGLGIYEWSTQSPNKSGWGEYSKYPVNFCKGMQCQPSATEKGFGAVGQYVGAYELPNGEDTIEVTATDPVGLTATTSGKVKVDFSLPYNIALSGLPANKEVGDSQVKVKATAKDGTTIETSGIESIALQIDGKEVGTASGSCTPGPCTATSGEWTVNGAEYPAGQHKATVIATSYAGDVAREEYTFDTGHLAVPVALGPGSVSPETGEFFLNATDVSVGGPGATLSLKRSYSSSHLVAGAEGPLGPQWSMSVGGAQSLTKAAEGEVVLTDAEGQESVFTSKGGGEFNSPADAASLKLTEVQEKGTTKEFLLKDGSGQVTKFMLPSGGSGSTWVPSTLEGPGATNVVTYEFQTVGGITEPTEVLGPVPTGVSCTAGLVKGCRALGFVYASKTTATGDGSSEWGEYEGRLKEVTFTAWEPTSGKMTTTAVAKYVYDKEGKLRGEWNPSISPALETTYGYDTAGHVTVLTPPGQQPWLFNYGTTSGDPRARIVSVTRPSASTSSGNGLAPVNTVAPEITTAHPRTGYAITVTNGTWSNSPLSYSYQWESCFSKESCKPILGATSSTYIPTNEESRYRFIVKVTATNANGAVSAASKESEYPRSGVAFEQRLSFGKEGTEPGMVKEPAAVAVESASGSEGDVWVADTGNNRIEKFTASGTFVGAYGSSGKESGQFSKPVGIAISENSKYVYVADSGNNRIQVFEAKTGKYLSQKSIEAPPLGLAIGKFEVSSGVEQSLLFVAVPSTNSVRQYTMNTSTGAIENGRQIGEAGTGNGQFKEPTEVAVSERGKGLGEGNELYVSDTGNHRVQSFELPLGGYFKFHSKFGSEGHGEGQFSTAGGIAIEPYNLAGLTEESHSFYGALEGDTFIADAGNNRVQQFSQETFEFAWNFGSGPQGLAVNVKHGKNAGNIYVVSAAAGETPRIAEWVPYFPSTAPEPPKPGGSAVTTVEYHVPVSGTGAPYAMGKTEVEAWGQKDDPTEATAIFPPDEPMGWPAKDYKRATVDYLDASARLVNVAHPGGGISTTEYNAKNDVERTLSIDNRATALKAGSKSAETSKLLDTENTYNAEGTELQSTLGPQHTVKLSSGATVEVRGHKTYSYDEGAPSEGGPYGLPTKTTEGAQYSGKEEDVRETTMSYSGQSNLGWKLHKPTSVTTDPKGLKLTHTTVYEPSTGEVTETILPAGKAGEKSAHGTETIYYTTAKNTTVPACGEHPEWANLPCQTQPSKQPGTSGLPSLPLALSTYNVWDEPEKTTETVGSSTRTKTATYDGAGRVKTSAVSSTVGTALPTVTTEYNAETGAAEKQCANEGKVCTEGKPKTITDTLNKLGELTSYTDADENTATYNYDIDGRVEKVNDGKGTQTYTYDTTTGDLTKLVDSAAGTFTGTYDTEGNLLTEGYPNGMNANYAYNQTGKPVSLEYVKTTHCTEKCTWFSDAVVPSIHGQWLSQASSLSGQAYTYDAAGRLTQVQNTPAGQGCTTRAYAYDEDTNRTSLTTFAPGSKGECTSTGGTVEKHAYDSADRLTDTGAKYSEFGNVTALAAADAGGTELTSTFYTDNQLASETQNGETIGFNLDPSGRTRETVSTGKTSQDIINHYAAGGASPAWTVETPSGSWTRNISGIGGLAAIQVNGATPVLQLTNLHGDIIATAALSETETKLLSSTDTSEFGVPTTSTPAKYSWLGGEQQPTELPSGEIDMGARSYIPQLGRFLQTDPVPGGSANAYAYTFGDPVNSSDPSGALTYGFSSWLKEANNQEAQEVVAREVARETLEREEAERREREAIEAEEAAAAAAAIPAAAEEPLGGSAGWACEYAAETHQEDPECGGGSSQPIYLAAGHGDPAPKPGEPGYHKGNPNEGACPKGSKGKSCGSRGGGSPSACDWVAGGGGGLVGAAVGGPFAPVTGAIGGWAASQVCG